MSAAKRAGLSPARLANLDRVLKEKYVDTGRLPGTLTQVWRRGELAHTSIVGSMDLERKTPMREDAIFRIYSMTKPITAVALMILVEEGKIGLGDDVATYIPSWKDLGVFVNGTRGAFVTKPPKRPMKVIDLATHTSGLTYPWMARTRIDAAYHEIGIDEPAFAGDLDAMMGELAKLPLEFSPGDKWNYSVSIDVLGYLVQKISGQSFGEFLRTRLFEPLGMNDTGFHCPASKRERFTSCYQAYPDDRRLTLQDDAEKSTYADPPKLESGGGGLVSTASDYMRFCRMFLGGGTLDGVQILSPKTVALFSLNHLPGNRGMIEMNNGWRLYDEAGLEGIGFSLACGVTMDVAKTRIPGTPGEFWWSGAANTTFWVDPKEDLAVVFMTQVKGSPHEFHVRRDVRTLVYSAFTASYA
jgi:CubicO group peptidase (beta-lactamase class C family)